MEKRLDYPMFQVPELPSKRKNQVVGRNCGTELKVGTVFTQVTKIRFLNYGREEIKHQVLEITQVKLCVEEIEAYGRSLSCLAAGMTGRLSLSGSGFAVINFVPQNHEYIHLESPNLF